jgi:hypothetical protein
MRAIAFRLKQATGLECHHTESKCEHGETPPIDLQIFHSKVYGCSY